MDNKISFSQKYKCITVINFLIAILFFMFFNISKHNPALKVVNVFGEDPFDAVGSFGIQLSLFAALISLIRTLRPYSNIESLEGQRLIVLRSNTVSLLSVVVTLIADIIAMLRDTNIWRNSQAGFTLAVMVVVMMILAAAPLVKIFNMVKEIETKRLQSSWYKSAFIWIICILVLMFYPESLHSGIAGGLLTAAVGMVILFVMVSSSAKALSPTIYMKYEDLFDDFNAIYQFLKGKFIFGNHALKNGVEIRKKTLISSVLDKLNPRKYKWNFAILIAVIMGVMVLQAESMGEGMAPKMSIMLMVTAVFISMEGVGVLLGYALLADFLGIIRREEP